MTIIKGSQGNDTLTVDSGTTSIQASAGIDTVIFSGNYDDYTFSQSDSYVSLMVNNTTKQIVSLFGVEQLQFDDYNINVIKDISVNIFQVNTRDSRSHEYPNIAILKDDGFVVSYSIEDGWNTGIFAQRYDINGNTIGKEVRVNTYIYDAQTNSEIAALNDGGYVITWQSFDQDDGEGQWTDGIYAQRYNADDSKYGNEFQVNTYTDGDQSYPSISAFNDGGFVIAWRSEDPLNSHNDKVYVKYYNADGSVNGNELILINDTNPSSYLYVSALSDNNFILSLDGTYAQRYNADGSTYGDEFLISDGTQYPDISYGAYHIHTYVSTLADGGFIAAWAGSGDAGYQIYAQHFDQEGNPLTQVVLNAIPEITSTAITTPEFVS